MKNQQEKMQESVKVAVDTTAVDALSAELAAVVAPQAELDQVFENEKKLEEELELSQAKGEAVQVASSDNGAAAMLLADTNAQSAGGAAAGGGAFGSGVSTGVLIAGGIGIAALAYAVADDDDSSSSAPAAPAPTPVADTVPVVSANQSVSAVQGKSAVITVTATDADGDKLTFAPSNPANGTVTPTSQPGQYTYTSNPTFVGTDTFTVTVSDEDGNNITRTITVNVTKAPLSQADKTFDLTTGTDTVVGTAEDDTINAKYVNSGAANSTLTAFDAIDGGAGTDTFNIYTDAATNNALPASASVKNVEIVNVFNSAAAGAFGDASKFVGVTQLNQNGASAANVTNLLATTTAGFNGTAQAAMNVTAEAAATSASVKLTGVTDATAGGTSTPALNISGAKLNAATVTGTLLASATGSAAANLALGVTADATATALTVNTAVASTLTVTGAALTSVDASASAGNVTYTSAPNTIATIKTGAGADTVTLATATSATVNASAETGAGNDAVTVNTSGVGKTTVTTGDGNDTVTVTASSTGGLTINTGAGNDTIKGAPLSSSTKIDGGAGTDTIELSNATFTVQDYILLSNTVSNVENVKFTAATTVDGSQLGQFSQLEFAAISTANKVAAAQKVVAAANLTIDAAGFVAAAGTTPVKGGVLNVTSTGNGTVTAKSEVVNLTVSTQAAVNADVATTLAAAAGDMATANVTLVSSAFPATGAVTQDNDASVTFSANAGAKTFTVTGEGSATVTNAGNTLATIDASGLSNISNIVATANNIGTGLTYNAGTNVETITLSSAKDAVTFDAGDSLYSAMDTVIGFDAVKETPTADLKSVVDSITFGGATLNGSATGQATKVTLSASATTLDLAFVEAAAANNAVVVSTFQFGGNTYLFKNATANGTLDNNDLALKVTGLVDFSDDFGVNP